MKNLIFLLSTLVASASMAASYSCEAILGLSPYDTNAIHAKIENFEITNLGSLAGSVVIGTYQFSFYQYDTHGGNISLTISEFQNGNQVTPYLSKAAANGVAPAKGQSTSVRLDGIAYLTCVGL